MQCEQSEILIGDAVYGELNPHQQSLLDAHLSSCNSCAALFDEMKEAKRLLNSQGLAGGSYDDIPERAGLDDLFQRLEPELNRIDAERFRHSQGHARSLVGAAIAVAASLIIAIAFTLQMPASDSGLPVANTDRVTPPAVDPALLQYLNRAELMLLQVANTHVGEANTLALPQNFARSMASEARVLTNAASVSLGSGDRKLLRDIEFLLLQIANLDSGDAAEGVALLQQFLDQEGILFKIRLLEMKEQNDVI